MNMMSTLGKGINDRQAEKEEPQDDELVGEVYSAYPFHMDLWMLVDSTGFPSVEADYEKLLTFIKHREDLARLDECRTLKTHIEYNENGQNKVINSRIKYLAQERIK